MTRSVVVPGMMTVVVGVMTVPPWILTTGGGLPALLPGGAGTVGGDDMRVQEIR